MLVCCKPSHKTSNCAHLDNCCYHVVEKYDRLDTSDFLDLDIAMMSDLFFITKTRKMTETVSLRQKTVDGCRTNSSQYKHRMFMQWSYYYCVT